MIEADCWTMHGKDCDNVIHSSLLLWYSGFIYPNGNDTEISAIFVQSTLKNSSNRRVEKLFGNAALYKSPHE